MSGDLKWNKIFGAGLATAMVLVGMPYAIGYIYKTKPPEKMGYFIDAPEEPSGTVEVELPPDWGTVLPVADLAAGEAAFARCQACHTVNQGGANGIGPNLWAVIGGPVMHMPGFAYSDAFNAHKAIAPVWTYDEMDQFIKAPQRHIAGTKMSFVGLKKSEDRVNLIAYLRAQGGKLPMPAPNPAAAAPAAAPADAAAPAAGADPAAAGAAPAAAAPAAKPAA